MRRLRGPKLRIRNPGRQHDFGRVRSDGLVHRDDDGATRVENLGRQGELPGPCSSDREANFGRLSAKLRSDKHVVHARGLRRLEPHAAMETAPGNVKKVEGVQASHQWIDFLPMTGVNPHRNPDCLTRFDVPGKVAAKWGEVRVVRSRGVSIHPDLRLPVNAAEDQPRHLVLPIGWDRYLFAIPTRTGISAEKPLGLSLHAQGDELVQGLLFLEALAFVIAKLLLRTEGHALGIPGSGHSNHSFEGDTALEPLFGSATIERIR